MSVTTRVAAACGVLYGLLSFACGSPARAQEEGRMAPQATQPPTEAVPEPEFPKTYGPLDASKEAHDRAERQRREAIDRQVQRNDEMVWYSGLPGYDRYPADLSTIYAYGGRYAYVYPYGGRAAARRTLRGSLWSWYSGYPSYGSRGLFEPWPLVPGDVYGYPYVNRVEQPLGHKVIQTGPNSYIYRPVYASDLRNRLAPAPTRPKAEAPVPEPIPAPPALKRGQPEAIPAPPPEVGPREF